jgi:hypothetical protein
MKRSSAVVAIAAAAILLTAGPALADSPTTTTSTAATTTQGTEAPGERGGLADCPSGDEQDCALPACENVGKPNTPADLAQRCGLSASTPYYDACVNGIDQQVHVGDKDARTGAPWPPAPCPRRPAAVRATPKFTG